MKLVIFSVYDLKAKAYLPPFFLPKEEMAVRVFTDCVNDPTHQFSKHPNDYTLFKLGDFNDDTGELFPESIPDIIAEAKALTKSGQKEPLK